MCGIAGGFEESQVSRMLEVIHNRGRDARSLVECSGMFFGHCLHAVVGEVSQPIIGRGLLLFNGEIYNWKDLREVYTLDAENDSQVLLALLDAFGVKKTRRLIDGVYAFAYLRDGKLTLERDLLGVKPLWYSPEPDFTFASEKKALLSLGLNCRELHPRTTLEFDVHSASLASFVREFTFPPCKKPLAKVVEQAVLKRVPDSKEVAVFFSGGVDSSLIAHIASKHCKVRCYVAALDDPEKSEPHDLVSARSSAKALGLELVEVRSTLKEVESLLPQICTLIETSNVVKVGVALPFLLCARAAASDGYKVAFSGLGAEEVFAGYSRHLNAIDINKECLRGLRVMHERDLYRDDVVTMSAPIELRLPLLDSEVVSVGLDIAGSEKIIDGMGKIPLRNLALELGVPESVAFAKKRAAQYGSQFDAAIGKLARKQGLSKSEYLRELYPANAKILALLSGGKDSIYAMHTLSTMNYDIVCAGCIISENLDSWMYHTPLIGAAKLQAQSLGIAYLEKHTQGVKEKELEALKALISDAIEKFSIDGVVSGALYSNYQRTRIERVCEDLGVKVYAPLWHIDQEQEVREILDAGFTFVISKVAADGLDASWVGRKITHVDIDKLKDKVGLNVAGEGGEYESLVLDGPGFSTAIAMHDIKVDCEHEGSVPICNLDAKLSLD